ncbi:MAG: DUF3619 family protein [Betaproteobacteria bacterium]
MTDDQAKFSKKITTYLDAGTAEIKSGTVYRLSQARAAALARIGNPTREVAPQSRLAHAFADGGGARGNPGSSLWKSGRLWLGILVIVAASFGYQQWRVVQQTREIEELDAQILTSDLPFDAYLDQGFKIWLTRREP